MADYLAEMFPPSRHLAVAFMTYLATAAFARSISGAATSVWSAYMLLGVWSYFAVPLLLRLMDELKDEDIDRELFPDRPLPSGRVSARDIRMTLTAVTVLFLACNAVDGRTFLAASVIAGYTFLMFRRFFAPRTLRKSLPITLATHNPIVPLTLTYGFFLFAAEHDLPLGDLAWMNIAPFILMLWAPLLAWEFSRKIRAPEDEDEYVTYSRLFGVSGAVVVMCVMQATGIAAAFWLSATLNASFVLPLIPTIAWLFSIAGGLRFVRNPNTQTANLKPFAEGFLLATLAAALVTFRAALV